MKIALIGATGQLGTDLKKIIPAEFITELNFPEFDVTNKTTVKIQLEQIRPDIVINTSAYNLVDKAETYPDHAEAVNALGPSFLAEACISLDCTLVHYSTDYVFGGDSDRRRPYNEDDIPTPLSVYGETKLEGGNVVRKRMKKHFVIRTSGLFGEAGSEGKGGNFIESVIRKAENGESVSVVDDQILTPTYTLDLARNTWELVQTKEYGLYHVTSEGQCSWYDFARAVFRHMHLPTEVTPVKTDSLNLRARRPAYSVLENRHLKNLNLNLMRHWEETIPDYLREKKYI